MRKFYTSLLQEKPESPMALKWCAMHGLLSEDDAAEWVRANKGARGGGGGGTPSKPRVPAKRPACESVPLLWGRCAEVSQLTRDACCVLLLLCTTAAAAGLKCTPHCLGLRRLPPLPAPTHPHTPCACYAVSCHCSLWGCQAACCQEKQQWRR